MLKSYCALALFAFVILSQGCSNNGRDGRNKMSKENDLDDTIESTYDGSSDSGDSKENIEKTLIGKWICSKSEDRYTFFEDHTGFFEPGPQHSFKSPIEWEIYGNEVCVFSEEFGGETMLSIEHGRLVEVSKVFNTTFVYHKIDQ